MKKLSTICAFVLVFILMSVPAFAITYCVDIIESGNSGGWSGSSKTWDNEWTIDTVPGGTITIDVWGNDCPGNMMAFGCKIQWDDTSLIECTSAQLYGGGELTGPWDLGSPTVNNITGFILCVASKSPFPPPGTPVTPDSDGDIIIMQCEFHCLGEGTATLSLMEPSGSYVIGEGRKKYDPTPKDFIVHQIETGECEEDIDCDDGMYCNGAETCVEGECQPGSEPCPGQICDEDTDSCETTPATTTTVKKSSDTSMMRIPKTGTPPTPDSIEPTTTITITTPITLNTTTLREPTTKTKESPESTAEIPSEITPPLSSPYQISISPSSVTLNSGEVVEFHANTVVDGKKVRGIYRWEIIPASTMGNSINENGLFTAGNNTSNYPIKEIVRGIDTLHDNSEATVTVTINIKKPSPVGCKLSISPSSVTLFPGETITFSAKNFGESCEEGSYKWKILSKMDSHISKGGIYTAGNNESGDSAFDIVLVKDTINNISIDAMVTVLSKGKVAQTPSGAIQKSPLKALSSKVLIIILVLFMLTGIVLFLKIK